MPWCVRLLLAAVVALVLATGCTSKKKKMEEAQKTRDAEKKAWEVEKAEKQKAAAPKVEEAQLEPFWGDPAYLKASVGRPCPEGLWSLFPETPGEGPEKDANEKKRADFAAKMKDGTFVVVLAHGGGLTLGNFNAKKKVVPVEVDGVMECFDKLGLLSIALNEPAKPYRPKEGEAPTPQAVWRAPPLKFMLPFDTAAEAKHFITAEGLGLSARVVFTLTSKTDVDKQVKKATPEEQPVDWGAGRVVHATVKGVRLATDHEKHEMLAQQKK